MSKNKNNLTTGKKHFILYLDQNNTERLLAPMPVYLGYNLEIYFLIHFSVMKLSACKIYQRKHLYEI